MKWIVYDKIGELHLRVGKKGGNSGQAKRWVIKKNIDTKPAHGRKSLAVRRVWGYHLPHSVPFMIESTGLRGGNTGEEDWNKNK